MASFQRDPDQIDRLSALPDDLLITILSLLPTRFAARTSSLSHRFRHLWKASPSVELSNKYLHFKNLTNEAMINIYVAMANSAILSRTSANPLLRLHLELYYLPYNFTKSFISSLLVHAHALGLRHLTIHGFCEGFLRSVFSISSLESLSIHITLPRMASLSGIALNRLKSLSINLCTNNFQRFLSELCCLEHLRLCMYSGDVCLSSPTIKKLELLLCNIQKSDSLGLFMPSLEFLSLEYCGTLENVPPIHGEIPLIRKAVVTLHCLCQKHVTTSTVAQFLNCISHVEELSLDLHEHMVASDYLFPVFLEPGKEVPTFPNLKHLDMSICFRECNFEAVVTMLHNCPALESLKLHHKSSGIAWRSMLPRNSDGNNEYACFKNLHLGESREEFKKLLNKKCTPDR